ncbi:MAG: bifunctional pyr operon transcriptional regulator/uracil phosphoribosyltransferase PyrR [Spirochaetes bacterium]|nr:MAG: bifunctional pyr operon transcriptional regulator/uracil phosphoribosyltransferase PyrR [Spirochaetota bacterium]
MGEQIILNKDDIARILDETADKIHAEIPNLDELAIVGIQTRGVELATRLLARLERLSGKKIRSGILDITFYRDDLATRGVLPVIKETKIEFNITKKTILLVDDVLFTGRTTKAALETLTTFGRPQAIRLFVLVDRGNRELPIQPDYFGFRVDTTLEDKVRVRLNIHDNTEDHVSLTRP